MTTIAATTRSFDLQRTGANLAETKLTPAYLRANGIRVLGTFPLGPDERGSEGMTLYVPGLTMGDGNVHDIVVHATMYNTVVAHDAATCELLWEQEVGVPIKGTLAMDMYLVNDYWGILSTPEADLETNTLFVVAMTSPTADFTTSAYVVHALSLVDGQPVMASLDLGSASYQAPGSKTVSTMSNVPRKQRCGLALDERNGTKILYVANGSFNEDADTNQGWVIAVNVTGTSMSIDSTFCTTFPPYSGGGIWMGAQGPSIDPTTGDLFLSVGNGDFDGKTSWGETVLRLTRTAGVGTAPSTLTVKDWFTPYTDSGRIGNGTTQTLASADDVPGQQDNPSSGNTSNMDDPGDEDLNSGGPLLILKALSGLPWNIVLAAGKDGIAYFINMDDMGAPTLADFAPDLIQANVYDKLLVPPYGFTYYPAGIDIAPTVLNEIPTTYGGFTHHMHSTAVFYNSAKNGPTVYCWGENGNLRGFALSADNNKLVVTYLGCSTETASPDCADDPPGGMPGGMLTLSANGNVDGVIWACVPYGDANKTITQGRLIAYDAENLANGVFDKLWDSQDWGIAFKHNKFNIPAAINGRVFCPTYQAETLLLG